MLKVLFLIYLSQICTISWNCLTGCWPRCYFLTRGVLVKTLFPHKKYVKNQNMCVILYILNMLLVWTVLSSCQYTALVGLRCSICNTTGWKVLKMRLTLCDFTHRPTLVSIFIQGLIRVVVQPHRRSDQDFFKDLAWLVYWCT